MGKFEAKAHQAVSRTKPARLLGAILFACVLVGAAGSNVEPAFAKKQKTAEAVKVQKAAKTKNAKKCVRGPVPPFMRNPRFMNRGFFKNRCKTKN